MRRPSPRVEWGLVGLITLGAAVLRLVQLDKVPPDPFYDAAVRSMTLSWHNFFFGALEPGASVSIDKPPIDLWLQVASVKVLGFSNTTLKLPEAFAGILAVPLLYIGVRKLWGSAAGIAAAAGIAILPVDVITSRSDTMDCVMMALTVLALVLVARAIETGGTRWLLAGAVALGLAFDVKLLESLVAVPGFVVLVALGMPGSLRRRALQLAGFGALYVLVALAWLLATLIAPAHDRPFALGSTNGSAWNAAFVYNGSERIGGRVPEPTSSIYKPGYRYPTATQSQRDHIPILPPSATRLLARVGPLSGERLGMEILIGIVLGIPALIVGVRGSPGEEDPELGDDEARRRMRIRRAGAAGIFVWFLTGLALFSHMARLHPRYTEGFTPAVAAMAGIGLAWAATGRGRLRLVALVVGVGAAVIYTERLMYGTTATWWIVLIAAAGSVGLALLGARTKAGSEGSGRPGGLLSAGALALALVAVLTVGLGQDKAAIAARVSDAGAVGQIPGDEQHAISAYVRAHQDGARYELAAESATGISSLVVQDAKPIVELTIVNAHVYTHVAKLKRLIAEGKVRYAFLNTFCTAKAASVNPACSEPVLWVRKHGTDVSRQAGLSSGGVLYLLPGAKP
jgi:4-amino-4-deoxy-L-arabinose transferase-like glycosyltransferase